MAWLTWILALLGIAQQSPAVQDAEGKALTAGLGVVKGIFDWIEEKETGHPMLQASTQYVEDMVMEHGADNLVAFLKKRGIEITVTQPTPPSPPQGA